MCCCNRGHNKGGGGLPTPLLPLVTPADEQSSKWSGQAAFKHVQKIPKRETLHPEEIVFQTCIITRCNSVKICKPTKNNHQCKLQDMIFVRVNSAEWAPIIRLSLVEEIFNIFIHLSSSLGASLGLLTTWQESVLWRKWGKQSAHKFVAFAVGERHWPGLWGEGRSKYDCH